MYKMPRQFRNFILLFFTTALVIAGVVFFLFFNKNSFGKHHDILAIRDASSGKVYGEWSLEETGEFVIEFIHSVNQSPVRETFRIEGKMIHPVSVRFSSFGAGMQSDVEAGQKLSRDGDTMILTGFNASYREINYIVGTVSDHLLIVEGETVSLRNLCGRNAHITICVK